MTETEIADWEREIRHAEKMQEQRKSKREGWDGKQVRFAGGKTYQLSETTKTTTWGKDNEINNQ